jgi:hypothetical protein
MDAERTEYIRLQQVALIQRQQATLDKLPGLIKRWRKDAKFLHDKSLSPMASVYEGCANALEFTL